jgi:hypothetical protein
MDGAGPLSAGADCGGYGTLIQYLASECRRQGASIHLGAAVTSIDAVRGGHS